MIVFFIIFFIILLSIMLIRTLNIKIEIKELNISNIEGKTSKELISTVKILIFHKITILKADVNNEKINGLNEKFKTRIAEKIDKDILKQILNPKTIFANREEIKKHFENIGIELEKFFLDLKIGTGELFTTAFLIPTLATIIAVFLSKKSDKIDYKDINYNIKPIYEDKFLYDIKFRCIINVRVVHIIYMIYVLKKGKKESDKCGGTSNRKFNANCNV